MGLQFRLGAEGKRKEEEKTAFLLGFQGGVKEEKALFSGQNVRFSLGLSFL